MYSEGFWNVVPVIKKIEFRTRGKIDVTLEDGRVIILPISAFPFIKKVPISERKNRYLTAGGFTWDACL